MTPSAKPPLAPVIFAAAALPLVLFAMRTLHAGLVVQGIVFIGLGSALPSLAKHAKRPQRTWLERIDGAFFGFAAAIAFVRCVHYATIALAEALRCAASETYESIARRFLDAQAAEVSRRVESSRAMLFATIMAIVIVPIVEERIYRDTVQRVFRERTSRTKALTAASALFALAHLGVYRAAIHQTFLIGIAFGAAYEEAGLAAVIAAHALYNTAQLF